MFGRALLALIAVISSVGCVRSSHQKDIGPADIAIVGVSVVPLTAGATVLPDHTVLVRDGRISAIGKREQISVPSEARVIDGRGRYMMPGLADSHVHLEYLDNPDILKLFVAHGVTSVRSMDGRPYIIDWRRAVDAGDLVGPRIFTAGPIIDGSPPARHDNLSVANGEAARAAVSQQAGAGYDFIKLYSNLSEGGYAAAIEEASRRGLKVAGHVPKAVPLDRAIDTLWTLEHLGDFAAAIADPAQPAPPGWALRALAGPIDQARLAALAGRFAKSGVWVVPTIIQQDRWLGQTTDVDRWVAEPAVQSLPAEVIEQWKEMNERISQRLEPEDWALLASARKNRLAVIEAFHRSGVNLMVGTDTPNPFVSMGGAVHQELANFVAAGMTSGEALKTATIAPARMMGLESDQGTVEVGKRADLLLLSGDPLADIANIGRLEGVILHGRWFGKEELENFRRALRQGEG